MLGLDSVHITLINICGRYQHSDFTKSGRVTSNSHDFLQLILTKCPPRAFPLPKTHRMDPGVQIYEVVAHGYCLFDQQRPVWRGEILTWIAASHVKSRREDITGVPNKGLPLSNKTFSSNLPWNSCGLRSDFFFSSEGFSTYLSLKESPFHKGSFNYWSPFVIINLTSMETGVQFSLNMIQHLPSIESRIFLANLATSRLLYF